MHQQDEQRDSELFTDAPIGMVLSGGGSRAAGFHFGSLEYLDRVGLRENLRMLSTVSGGTFIGAKYAACLAEGYDFDAFFDEFYHQLRDTPIVGDTVRRVGSDAEPGDGYRLPSRRQDLIAHAAEVYAQTFLRSRETGKPYRFGAIADAPTSYPLWEVVFNATEYRTGVAFRFQRNGPMGNVNFGWDERQQQALREEFADVRLADIVAASSCLPGLFEPLCFPHDFAWPDGRLPRTVDELFRNSRGEPRPLPLMDGGIYDNQGIESLILADLRLDRDQLAQRMLSDVLGEGAVGDEDQAAASSGTRLGMFIVSDADRPESDILPYDGPEEPLAALATRDRAAGVRLATLETLGKGFAALCAVGAAVGVGRLLTELAEGTLTPWDWTFYLCSIVLLAATAAGFWKLRAKVKRLLLQIPQTNGAAWRDIRRVRVARLQDLLLLRLRSAVESFTSVMPKRARELGYWVLYANSEYHDKRVSNLIYQLAGNRDVSRLQGAQDAWRQAGVPAPSPALRALADRAASMATRYSYQDEAELQSVLACGQATICLNLMKFVVRRHGGDAAAYPRPIEQLWRRLRSDWDVLNADPGALLRERLARSGAGAAAER